MRRRPRLLSVIAVVVIAASVWSQQSPSARAQSEAREKPKLKHFGSSLDQLRWDKDKQAAVEKSETIKANADDENVVRVETRLIASDVLVLDGQGRPVANLTQDDFAVTEDGQAQTIAHFSRAAELNVPKSIIFIADYSCSQAPYIEKSMTAAKRLINQLGPNDRMAIVTDDVDLLVKFTNDKKRLSNALGELVARARLRHFGKSDQFSALMATARELISNEDIRPIIVFQTDGDQIRFLQPPTKEAQKQQRNRIKPFSLDDILLALEKSRATVYTVIPNVRLIGVTGDELTERAREAMERFSQAFFGDHAPSLSKKQLQQIVEENLLPMQQAAAKVATATGGWTAFLEYPEQADGIYERIMADINSRYVVGYYFPDDRPRDGKRHQFTIAVKNHPEYQIQGRKSYIAPQSNR